MNELAKIENGKIVVAEDVIKQINKNKIKNGFNARRT